MEIMGVDRPDRTYETPKSPYLIDFGSDGLVAVVFFFVGNISGQQKITLGHGIFFGGMWSS